MHKILIPLLLAVQIQAASYNNKLEFGLKTTSYDYTERDSEDKVLDTERSDFFEVGGIYGSYDHKIKESRKDEYDIAYYINLYGSIEYGDTDYIGSILGSNQGYGSSRSTTANSFYEFQANLKRVTNYQKSSRYIGLGLGYKEWKRELSVRQIETYYYFFMQAVLGGEISVFKKWYLGLDLTAQLAYKPKMDADFSGSTQSLHETFDLGRTYTYKLAIPLRVPLYKELSFVTKAEYAFTSIGRSNVISVPDFPNPGDTNSFLEPDSQQKNWHLYAGLQLTF